MPWIKLRHFFHIRLINLYMRFTELIKSLCQWMSWALFSLSKDEYSISKAQKLKKQCPPGFVHWRVIWVNLPLLMFRNLYPQLLQSYTGFHSQNAISNYLSCAIAFCISLIISISVVLVSLITYKCRGSLQIFSLTLGIRSSQCPLDWQPLSDDALQAPTFPPLWTESLGKSRASDIGALFSCNKKFNLFYMPNGILQILFGTDPDSGPTCFFETWQIYLTFCNSL